MDNNKAKELMKLYCKDMDRRLYCHVDRCSECHIQVAVDALEQAETFEKIRSKICDKYCKYPERANNQQMMDKICKDCPLDKVKETK